MQKHSTSKIESILTIFGEFPKVYFQFFGNFRKYTLKRVKMSSESVLLQRWQAGARRFLLIAKILTRNNSYSVKNFLKKTLD